MFVIERGDYFCSEVLLLSAGTACSESLAFDYFRRSEPGGPNGVAIIAAVKARNCQRALPVPRV